MTTPTPETIIATIKQQNIEPRPRWQFLVRRYSIWALFGATIFCGAFALAGVLYAITHSEWQYWRYVHSSLTGLLTHALPPLWVLSFGVLCFVSIWAAKTTEHGYRFRPYRIIFVSILLSFVLAVGIEQVSHPGGYDMLSPMLGQRDNELWNDPDDGRIAGTIANYNTTTLVLYDVTGKEWNIDVSHLTPRSVAVLHSTNKVKVIGQATSAVSEIKPLPGTQQPDGTFLACIVLPSDLPPMMHRHPMMQHNPSTAFPARVKSLCESILNKPKDVDDKS